ncbi:SPOR domain-containing protein [Vibrio mexicanus]|uniref:SPOR domain-containing protein n=1 Tax=Vibrio mexicanus TaxID=1004326 RepID=UPI00069CB0CC|nr:SPOR domain-containing protein [Vibrio mexicanus]
MERSRAVKPLVTCTKLMAIAAFALPVWLPSVQAQEFLCDATQASTNELPVLEKNCPIGKGLWGNQKPKHKQSTFWIQCGLLNKPLSLADAKSLYNVVSGDVWNKPEDKGTRCLIGPYQDYKQAASDLVNVRKVKSYEEAFIREVANKSAGMAKTSPKPVQRQPEKPNKATSTAAAVTASPIASSAVEVDKEMPSEVTIRLTAEVAGVTFKVPYLMFSDEQFYMEHNLPWNRLNYKSAGEVCADIDMMLPTEAQWQQLLDANIMSKNKWPMHLPYWGKDRKALFTTGKVSQLKGTSLLNVTCVK